MPKRDKKSRITVEADSSPLGISLGALLGKEDAPDAPKKEAKNAAPEAAAKKTKTGSRAILAREIKGRGGKTVTAISFRDGTMNSLGELAKELRTSLGCGGVVEGERIILQGDQVERASAWLAAKGVKTTKGN